MRDEFFSNLRHLLDGIEGCVVECGVARGESLIMLAKLIQVEGKGRELWGFDSWESWPPYSPEDRASDNPKVTRRKKSWAEGESYPCRYTPKDVVATFAQHGFTLGWPVKTHLSKGYFNDTLLGWDKPIALLNIDVDIYQSYKDVLGILWSYISEGGIVIFDEYHETVEWPGARKAVDEFLATVPHKLHEGERWWAVKC